MRKLSNYLLEKRLITREQFEIGHREHIVTGQGLGSTLVSNGFLRRTQLRAALLEIDPAALMGEDDLSVELKLPRDFMLATRTIVAGDLGDELVIATLHPEPEFVRAGMQERLPGKSIRLGSAPVLQIHSRLRTMSESSGVLDRIKVAEDEDINRIIETVFNEAVRVRATDIHLEPTSHAFNIRFRVDTVMSHEFTLPMGKYDRIIARVKDRASMDVSDKRNPQDGAFSFTHHGVSIDCRVASVLTAYGEKLALRLLNKDTVLIDIRDLGIARTEEWLELTRQRDGIILVSGPTGSGKSTTLYSTLMSIDRLHRQVYTCEDPVEYRIPYLNQCQINYNTDPPFDYAAFGRAILRLNPDVIVFGELRDEETVKYAIRSAETGHLVYGTVHNNDAATAISRLTELGASIEHLKHLIRGVLVQRLARKLCNSCRGAGCDACRGGYHGMVPVVEFVALRSPEEVVALQERQLPYYTFQDDAAAKVAAGLTDCRELSRITAREVKFCRGGRCTVPNYSQCSNYLT